MLLHVQKQSNQTKVQYFPAGHWSSYLLFIPKVSNLQTWQKQTLK